MSNIIFINYKDNQITFNEDGWFNATQVAEVFGKRPGDWLSQIDTAEYLAVLLEYTTGNSDFVAQFNIINELKNSSAKQSRLLSLSKKTGFVKTKQGAMQNGGGTWFHPDLAVAFARWIDVHFSIWCDKQIKSLISGQHVHYDWKKMRHESASSFKVMNQILKLTRERTGKTSPKHIFSNEARLINWALTGTFGKVDRDSLCSDDLDLLAKLEQFDTVLIGCGADYEARKEGLSNYVSAQRKPMIAA